MPRLTNPQYLAQRQALRSDWFENRASIFSRLEPINQMDLHAYFAPTEDLSDAAAITHRELVTALYPSLPQAAGRSYARSLEFLGQRPAQTQVPRVKSRGSSKHRKVIATTLLHPHPDLVKLQAALDRIKEQKDKAA